MIYFLFNVQSFKTFKNVNIMKTPIFQSMKHYLKGHLRSYKTTFRLNSSTFVHGPILLKIYMNANFMKTQFFPKVIYYYDLKCHFYVVEKLSDFLP